MTQKSAIESAAPSAEREYMYYVDPSEIVVVGYDTVDGPEHDLYEPHAVRIPRDLDAKLAEGDEYMVQSIMEVGVLTPIAVRKDGGKIQSARGRTRTVLTRFANHRRAKQGLPPMKIPVGPLVKGDRRDFVGHAAVENENRRVDTYEDRAARAKHMLDLGFTLRQIGVRFGKPIRFVQELLAYFDMDPTVQKAVNAGEIAPQAAVELVKKPREEQKTILEAAKAESLATGKTGARAGRVSVQAVRNVDRRAEGKDDHIPRSIWKKVVELPGAKELEKVDPVKMMRVMLGQLPLSAVAGLTALVKEAAGPKGGKS